MWRSRSFWNVLAIIIIVTACIDANDIIVDTKVGTFIGTKEDVVVDGKDTKIAKFLGIPFAEAPVGNLRFKIPVAKKPFEHPKIVKESGDRCLQLTLDLSVDGAEDCLFLNVFVPEHFVNEKMAVMIFIHGGAFYFGSGNDYNPTVLATLGQTVIVTISYRLGVMGFLSTGDSNAPGNYGLWDQRLAIKWVKDNIEGFGGDPTRITLFGESAGAASVLYQAMYPGNEGLFHRIIAQSGSTTPFWANQVNPYQNAMSFVQLSECETGTVESTIECLRGAPLDKLKTAMMTIDKEPLSASTFIPTVDNVFVSCSTRNILDTSLNADVYNHARDMFATIDFMSGINSGESGIDFIPLHGVFGDPNNFRPNKTYFDEVLVPTCVRKMYPDDELKDVDEASIIQSVINQYTDKDEPNNPLKTREMFHDMYSDAQFLAPMYKVMDAHATWSSKGTYMYYLSILPSFHVFPPPTWLQRANHADDLLYLFPTTMPLYNPPFDSDETDVSRQMIQMWTNFAKTGNPNIPIENDLNFNWQQYKISDARYLDIKRNMSRSNLKENLGKGRAKFWNELVSYREESCSFAGDTNGAASNTVLSAVVILCILFAIFIQQFDIAVYQ